MSNPSEWPPAKINRQPNLKGKRAHEILGIPKNADEETIKAARRRYAKEGHPDIAGTEAHNDMSTVNKAATDMLKRFKEQVSKPAFVEAPMLSQNDAPVPAVQEVHPTTVALHEQSIVEGSLVETEETSLRHEGAVVQPSHAHANSAPHQNHGSAGHSAHHNHSHGHGKERFFKKMGGRVAGVLGLFGHWIWHAVTHMPSFDFPGISIGGGGGNKKADSHGGGHH